MDQEQSFWSFNVATVAAFAKFPVRTGTGLELLVSSAPDGCQGSLWSWPIPAAWPWH